jgi:hypothetical protein
MGDVTRHSADLGELVQGVIDMVGHLGRYHDKPANHPVNLPCPDGPEGLTFRT